MAQSDSALTKQALLQQRTRAFAVVAVRLCRLIGSSFEGRHIAGQLIRCSTSVAANYRAVCRARSLREFVAKMGIVLEESDEALFWLDLAKDLGLVSNGAVQEVYEEARQLTAIFTSAYSTAKRRTKRPITKLLNH